MSENNEVLIESWSIVSSEENPYTAPELRARCLHGTVYNHPRFPDGEAIMTSSIMRKDGDIVITFSGTRYKLGDINPEYEQTFPGARERFLKSLRRT
jgi:hypothetical protein